MPAYAQVPGVVVDLSTVPFTVWGIPETDFLICEDQASLLEGENDQ